MGKYILMCVFSAVLFSCGSGSNVNIPPIDQTDPVSITPIETNIGNIDYLSDEAKRQIDFAKKELEQAKKEAEEAKNLVEEMRKNNSPFAERIETLRKIYEERIAVVQKQLDETGVVLKKQKEALKIAKQNLDKAKQQSLASENEKKQLRAANELLQKSANENAKYKDKYYKLTKYKWIVWGIGAWLVIKFLGSLGAWSPQGRVARFLIG